VSCTCRGTRSPVGAVLSRRLNEPPVSTAEASREPPAPGTGRPPSALTTKPELVTTRLAQLAAWSLVHGFAMLWLNDAVNARVKATDPITTVQRIATILFND